MDHTNLIYNLSTEVGDFIYSVFLDRSFPISHGINPGIVTSNPEVKKISSKKNINIKIKIKRTKDNETRPIQR